MELPRQSIIGLLIAVGGSLMTTFAPSVFPPEYHAFGFYVGVFLLLAGLIIASGPAFKWAKSIHLRSPFYKYGLDSQEGDQAVKLPRLKRALEYIAFETDADVSVRRHEETDFDDKYAPLLGSAESLFSMAAKGHIEIYGRLALNPTGGPWVAREQQAIPAMVLGWRWCGLLLNAISER